MTTNNYFSPYNRLNNAAATPLPEPTVPLGRTGIPARVMRKDIESLLIEFKKRDNLKLSTFAETWNELGWTYIHLACPNNDVQPLFMQGLYNTVFSLILREGPSYADRITAVYALYYLYFTQPPVKYAPTIRIRTSLRLWQHIVGFLRQILDDSCDAVSAAVKEDVRYTLYRLRSEDAWDFVAVQTPPQWSGHRPEQDDMLQWEVILHDKVEEMEQQLPALNALPLPALNEIAALDQAYANAKAQMADLPYLSAGHSAQPSSQSGEVTTAMHRLVAQSSRNIDGRRMISELRTQAGHKGVRDDRHGGRH